MGYDTIARVLVKEYGSQYHLELRKTSDYKGVRYIGCLMSMTSTSLNVRI